MNELKFPDDVKDSLKCNDRPVEDHDGFYYFLGEFLGFGLVMMFVFFVLVYRFCETSF